MASELLTNGASRLRRDETVYSNKKGQPVERLTTNMTSAPRLREVDVSMIRTDLQLKFFGRVGPRTLAL